MLATSPMPIKLECPVRPGHEPTTVPDEQGLTLALLETFGVPDSKVEPHGRGAFNDVYLVTLDTTGQRKKRWSPEQVVVRIVNSLKLKSDIDFESEVATMMYVKEHTNIPLPAVYAYCSSVQNAVGRPFMITSFMRGSSAIAWDRADEKIHLRTVHSYARIVSQLIRCGTFDNIGSLYVTPQSLSSSSPQYKVGRISWVKCCSLIRRTFPLYDRGPWENASQWLSTSLRDELQLMELAPDAAKTSDGELLHWDPENESWDCALRVLPELLAKVPDVTSDNWSKGPFFLCHMDFGLDNMLFELDGPDAGEITAVLDWEMASTVPLWRLVSFPEWFYEVSPISGHLRPPSTVQAFEDAYLNELRSLNHDKDTLELAREGVWRDRFAQNAAAQWIACRLGERWLQEYGRKSTPGRF